MRSCQNQRTSVLLITVINLPRTRTNYKPWDSTASIHSCTWDHRCNSEQDAGPTHLHSFVSQSTFHWSPRWAGVIFTVLPLLHKDLSRLTLGLVAACLQEPLCPPPTFLGTLPLGVDPSTPPPRQVFTTALLSLPS